MKSTAKIVFSTVLVLLASIPATAEEGWKLELAPFYLWAVGLQGSQALDVPGLGRLEQEVDISFSDVVEQLDAGGTMHFEARKGAWGFLIDASLLDLVNEVDQVLPVPLPGVPPGTPVPTRSELLNSPSELALLRRLAQNEKRSVELVLGARYTLITVDLTIPDTPFPPLIDFDEDWLDPYVGVYYRAVLSEKWSVHLRGDVGGFGLGSASDFAWHFNGLVGYKLSRRIHLLAGYRAIDYDYESDTFVFDAREEGLVFGVAFRFGSGIE